MKMDFSKLTPPKGVRTDVPISPKQAQTMLERNTNNRPLRNGCVEQYTLDMKNGVWTECAGPIVFYEDGSVADGQHRLWALVESNTTQVFDIKYGFPRPAGLNVDCHRVRTVGDSARIAGIEEPMGFNLVAACRFYIFGKRNTASESRAYKLEYVSRCRKEVEWAMSSLPRVRGFTNGPTLAAVARAYKAGVDPERLHHFCRVYATGFGEGSEDSAAIALRNFVISENFKTDQRDLFLRTMNCIKHFVKKKPLNVVRAVSEEMYPLQ